MEFKKVRSHRYKFARDDCRPHGRDEGSGQPQSERRHRTVGALGYPNILRGVNILEILTKTGKPG
jgi:hypothetical protein